ncbi:hypothetical protein GH714_018376 [Hevea brasiliensis]|uniref:C3H1-type domain-containing protein n=1 Tax=Hevea brasiliensis TaxID=3981 RepID=A0A6A6MB78_HEVBR|nr:hypothetical protein GH714_018376 [Hevea brasiliensis]
MQNDAASTTANDDLNIATESQEFLPNEVDFTSIYCPKSSHTLTPYLDSHFVTQQQDLINRSALCLTRLREAAREVESLRLENAALRSVNRELNNQLSFVIQSSVQKHCLSSDCNTTPFEILNGFHNLCNIGGDGGEELCEDEIPTSVKERETVDATDRASLPKSISVRSNGYLKTSQAGQKVYVRGGKKEEKPLELEVYNQGMFKTELCNKWQETGTCPYGDHCQFAHGVEELRPVIRHPRYKTEVCRMVLAGDICPYGHRCHFRHVLTEQERFMGHLKPRAIKLERFSLQTARKTKSKDGNFSVQYAVKLLENVDRSNNNVWKTIWSRDGPQRVRVGVFSIRYDYLVVVEVENGHVFNSYDSPRFLIDFILAKVDEVAKPKMGVPFSPFSRLSC